MKAVCATTTTTTTATKKYMLMARQDSIGLHGQALLSPLVEEGLRMHFLLPGERPTLEDEKIVLRSGGFDTVYPELFHWRFAPAWLELS